MKIPMFRYSGIAIVSALLRCVLPGCSCNRKTDSAEQPIERPSDSQTADEERSEAQPQAEAGAPAQPAEAAATKGDGPQTASDIGGNHPTPTAKSASKNSVAQRNQSDSPGGSSAGSTPQTALREAKKLEAAASKAAASGDSSLAFQKTLEAWQLVRQYPDDPGCRKLESLLAPQLEEFGEAANAARGGSGSILPGRRVIVQ